MPASSASSPSPPTPPSGSGISDVNTQATLLAGTALKQYSEGNVTDATRNIKHALSLAPGNASVLVALNTIREAERLKGNAAANIDNTADGDRESEKKQLLDSCAKLAAAGGNPDRRVCEAATMILTRQNSTTAKTGSGKVRGDGDDETGKKCLELFLEKGGGGEIPRIVGLLLRSGGGMYSSSARKYLIDRIREDAQEERGSTGLDLILGKFVNWGREAMDALVGLLLNSENGAVGGWEGKKDREKYVRICFRWFVGSLGKRNDETVHESKEFETLVRAVSKIMIAETEMVKHLMNRATFGALMDVAGGERGRDTISILGMASNSTQQQQQQQIQATTTLSLAKYLLSAGTPGQSLLREYLAANLLSTPPVTDTVEPPNPTSTPMALTALCALFPLIQPFSTALLTENNGQFVKDVVHILENFCDTTTSPDSGVEQWVVVKATLKLLSVASGEKACRAVIASEAIQHLEGIVARKGERWEEVRGLAAVTLAKIRYGTEVDGTGVQKQTTSSPIQRSTGKGGLEELANIFKSMVIRQATTTTAAGILGGGGVKDEAVEGLAYSSLKREVKEALVMDKTFLVALFKIAIKAVEGNSGIANTTGAGGVIFGVLTVLANIAAYPPALTEEQKKVQQLKRYADASALKGGVGEGDEVEDEEKVTERCKKLLDAGIMPVLGIVSKSLLSTISSSTSPSTSSIIVGAGAGGIPGMGSLLLISRLILSLGQSQRHRPLIAQQGGVKLLLTIYNTLLSMPFSNPTTSSTSSSPLINDLRTTTAHALSRILVSVNPALTFSASTPASTAVRPLVEIVAATATGVSPSSTASTTASTSTPSTGGLLATFESLLALTNLASLADPEVTRQLERMALGYLLPLDSGAYISSPNADVVNPLILSSNIRIQRAAVELVCNLASAGDALAEIIAGPLSPGGGSTKEGGNPEAQATRTIHILLALADARDFATRCAAAGALAGLFSSIPDITAKRVLCRDRGVKALLRMLRDSGTDEDDAPGEGGDEDEDDDDVEEIIREDYIGTAFDREKEQRWEDMVMRGLVCLRGLVEGGAAGAVEEVRKERGREVLAGVVKRGVLPRLRGGGGSGRSIVGNRAGEREWLGEAVEVLKLVS